MDPARPSDPDPADPFFPERGDHEILETIEIATEGEDCDECVRKLRPVLMKIPGVKDVKVRAVTNLPRWQKSENVRSAATVGTLRSLPHSQSRLLLGEAVERAQAPD